MILFENSKNKIDRLSEFMNTLKGTNLRNNSRNVHFPPDLLFMWYFALTVNTMLKLNCV